MGLRFLQRHPGGCAIALVAVLTILMAYVAGSYVMRTHEPPPELIAISEMHRIGMAEENCRSKLGRYGNSIQELWSVDGAPRILDEKRGYRFRVGRTARGYSISANPIRCGPGASRSFFAEEDFAVHQRACPEPAGANDPVLK